MLKQSKNKRNIYQQLSLLKTETLKLMMQGYLRNIHNCSAISPIMFICNYILIERLGLNNVIGVINNGN
jgi:hypothetical protein